MRRTGQIFWLLASGEVENSVQLSAFSVLLPAFTAAEATIGPGKSYPVTAAQLLPIFTGFLAPIL
jgi:hypothetical protein